MRILVIAFHTLLAAAVLDCWLASGAEEIAKVSYDKEIRPIFQVNCFPCHQPAKVHGAYVMTAFDRLIEGGRSGRPAIVPGRADESYLVELITPAYGEAEMPLGLRPPLATAELARIRQWITEGAIDDTPAGAELKHDAEHPPEYSRPLVIASLDFSPDGELLAVAGFHEVLLVKADGSELVARLVGISERIESVKFSPDGRLLAAAGGSPPRMGEIQVWDVAVRKLKLSVPMTYDTVYAARWSPDGKLIAFGCTDNTARAIDAQTGEQVQGAHSGWVRDTVFNADGSHGVPNFIRELPATQRRVTSVAVNAEGARIAVGLSLDGAGEVDVYEYPPDMSVLDAVKKTMEKVVAQQPTEDKEKLRHGMTSGVRRVSHARNVDSAVCAVAFRPDGKVVAAAGNDGTVRLFDPKTGRIIMEFSPAPVGRDWR